MACSDALRLANLSGGRVLAPDRLWLAGLARMGWAPGDETADLGDRRSRNQFLEGSIGMIAREELGGIRCTRRGLIHNPSGYAEGAYT